MLQLVGLVLYSIFWVAVLVRVPAADSADALCWLHSRAGGCCRTLQRVLAPGLHGLPV